MVNKFLKKLQQYYVIPTNSTRAFCISIFVNFKSSIDIWENKKLKIDNNVFDLEWYQREKKDIPDKYEANWNRLKRVINK
jgi:hypothetical protein